MDFQLYRLISHCVEPRSASMMHFIYISIQFIRLSFGDFLARAIYVLSCIVHCRVQTMSGFVAAVAVWNCDSLCKFSTQSLVQVITKFKLTFYSLDILYILHLHASRKLIRRLKRPSLAISPDYSERPDSSNSPSASADNKLKPKLQTPQTKHNYTNPPAKAKPNQCLKYASSLKIQVY